MVHVAPNYDWYKSISDQRHLPARCPYAHVRRCPRYFYSRSLLGDFGSTRIEKDLDDELTGFWEQSDVAPMTAEDQPSVTRSGDKHPSFWKFCPEVLFDRYGWFVSDLATYSDEIDQGAAHKMLETAGVSGSHPNWTWSVAEPMHYTDCPQYSLLQLPKQEDRHAGAGVAVAAWWKRNEVIGWASIGVAVVGLILAVAVGG